MAQAEAERIRIIKEGEAAGLKTYMEAEAAGTLAQLEARAKGFQSIVTAAGGADKAAQLMVTEQLPGLVAEQVKAISGIKIDKLTVWDSGRTGEDGKTRTADFLSGLVGSVPPLHEIATNVGIELPGYLGKPASSSGGKKPALQATRRLSKSGSSSYSNSSSIMSLRLIFCLLLTSSIATLATEAPQVNDPPDSLKVAQITRRCVACEQGIT